VSKSPKITLLDIETSPLTAYSWTAFDANALKILEFSKVLSVAWKQLGDKEVTCKTISDYKGYKKGVVDDEKLIREVWKILDESDIVIGHHSDAFDLKKLNSRFVYYGLNAPSSYKSIDTKKVCSKQFKLDSNSLNNIGSYLNLGNKLQNGGFDLWVRCIAGDPQAWELMREYNIQDVVLLEKVYLAIRPFIVSHPNLNLITDKEGCSCPSCQSTSLMKRGFTITKTGKKQRYQCTECGSWSSGKFEKSTNILSALQ